MKAHIVENGVIVNTVVVQGLSDGMIDGSVGGIGWNVVDGVPVPPQVQDDGVMQRIIATDAAIIRVIEDIYSVLTADQKSALPQAAKDKIAERQALRAKL